MRTFHAGLQMGMDQGTTDRTRGLKTEWSSSMMQGFRKSSEALGLSQVSEMLRQLTGQISAHYSSSKTLNTHLHLFRPDQGPHTVCHNHNHNRNHNHECCPHNHIDIAFFSHVGRQGSNITVVENHSILHSFFFYFSPVFL